VVAGYPSETENLHLLLPWLTFTIKGLEQDWLAQCQYNVTVWGIIYIHGMVLWCAGTFKYQLESAPVTADLTTTDVYIHVTEK